MKTGYFIISLDFELYWGIFDKVALEDRMDYFNNTLEVIPKILDLFEQYQIKATWASVGFLFFDDLEHLNSHMPKKLPHYHNKQLSAYHYINKQFDKQFSAFHFAPELIKLINNTPGQEVGTHTLSHYYCLEPGQDAESFEADLITHQTIAKEEGINLQSLVFPRNQYQKDYEPILIRNGIKVIRTNPDVWFWDTTKKETLLTKIFRTADAYIPLHYTSFTLEPSGTDILLLSASRFLRPWSPYNLLNRLRQKRVKQEMLSAAKRKEYYHLWWHPHNFGYYPEQSLKALEELLIYYQQLHNKYGFKSMNMTDIVKQIKL